MSSENEDAEASFIRSLRTGRASLRTLVRYVRNRRGQSDELSRDMDNTLVTEYRRLQAYCNEMEQCQESLRKMVQQALSPPWFPVLFLDLVQVDSDVFAKVVENGTPRLVHVDDKIDTAKLHRGDEVYLSEKRNLLIYKATTGQSVCGGVATVEGCLDDGRLLIKERETQHVVTASRTLAADSVNIGDRVRWSEPAMLAIEKVDGENCADQFLIEEVTDTPRQQLGGMNHVRDGMIDRYVQHIAHQEVASDYGVVFTNRRLLMEGPPGCGKTLMARILASALKRETGRPVRLAIVSGSSLYDPYVGQTEKNITALFQVAPDFDGTSMIFLDEIDAIGRARGSSGNSHADRFLGTLLAKLEGFECNHDVVVIAATNRAEMLDAALVERFAYRLKVERPSRTAAREIFRIHMPESLPIRPNGASRDTTLTTMIEMAVARLYDENADNQIARLSFRDGKTRQVFSREMMSGRLIEQIALAARQHGFERHVSGGQQGIVVGDMEVAVSEAIDRLAATLSINNAHSHLTGLPTTTEVISVEPVARHAAPERYLQHGGAN